MLSALLNKHFLAFKKNRVRKVEKCASCDVNGVNEN